MEPLISIIVPVYNVENYIDRCVKSIVNQTYKNIEIILVDDGSPDNCPSICDAWAEKDSRIRVIHKENGGVSSARNAGLDIASGSYIGFVDSDDYISDEMYQILLKAIVADNSDIAICNFVKQDNGERIDTIHYEAKVLTESDDIIIEYLTNELCAPGVPNRIFSAEVIGNLRFDTKKRIGEDFLFNYFALRRAEKVTAIDTELYYYCFDRSESAVHSLLYDMVTRWKNNKLVLDDLKNDAQLYEVCRLRYVNEMLCCCRELLRSRNKQLIDSLYPSFVSEIKENYYDFISLNLSGKNRFSIKIIRRFPNLFKFMYSVFIRVKR